MVEPEFSCIKEVTKTVHLALPALYVTNELAGVSDLLESWKRQYIQQLEGVVVSYKNVSLASNSGFIVIDKPFVHYDVKATFELFCPSIGSIVKGKINRVSYDYVGCLVHNTINAAIELSENASDELVNFIALDHIILFKITCFDFHRRTIRVKGEITDECISLMKELPLFNTQNDVIKSSQSTFYSTSELSEDATSCDVRKEVDENDATFEDTDSDSQSQSLLAPNVLFQNVKSDVFNVDYLADKAASGTSSFSYESDSSQSNQLKVKSKKHPRHKTPKKDVQENNSEETMELEDSVLDFKSSLKRKQKEKKSKHKSSKKYESSRESATHSENHLFKSPSKKKKNESLSDSNVFSSSISDTETTDNIKNSPKKKSSKKSSKQQGVSKIPEFSSPKKVDLSSSIANLSMKEEVPTDSSYSTLSPKKKKSKKFIHTTNNSNNDIDSIINALSAFQPGLDDQVLLDQASTSVITSEPPEMNKKDKKRKRDSIGKDDLPAKKKKTNKDPDASTKKSKDKSKKKKDSKKRDKKNPETISKKDKKKKSKDKILKSKKAQLSYKIKSKKDKKRKDKKSKTKKPKKSSKDKTKKVPGGSSIKSEIN